MPATELPDTHARDRLRRLALAVVPTLAAPLLTDTRKRIMGRIAGRQLSPRYRATLVATDAAGNALKRTQAAFRVVKP